MLIYASILTRRVHWKRRMNTASTSGKKKWGHGTLETRGEDIFLSSFFFFFLYKYNFSLKNIFLKRANAMLPEALVTKTEKSFVGSWGRQDNRLPETSTS